MTAQIYNWGDQLSPDTAFQYQVFGGDFNSGYARLPFTNTEADVRVSSSYEAITPGIRQLLLEFKMDDPSAALGTAVAQFGVSGNNIYLEFVSQGAGVGFKVNLWIALAASPFTLSLVYSGTTTYAWATTYYLIWYEDTAAGYDRVAIGTSLGTLAGEINYVRAGGLATLPNQPNLYALGLGQAAKYLWFKHPTGANGADLTELLDPTAMVSGIKTPTSGTPNQTGFANVTPGGTNKWDDVDDWAAGAPDDDTTSNNDDGTANTTFSQTHKTTALTLANIRAVYSRARLRGNINGKTNTGYLLTYDGTTLRVGVSGSLVDKNWIYLNEIYQTKPSGGAWTQATLDALEIGYRDVVGAQADACYATAVQAVAFGAPLLASEPSRATELPLPLAGPVLTAGGVGVV